MPAMRQRGDQVLLLQQLQREAAEVLLPRLPEVLDRGRHAAQRPGRRGQAEEQERRQRLGRELAGRGRRGVRGARGVRGGGRTRAGRSPRRPHRGCHARRRRQPRSASASAGTAARTEARRRLSATTPRIASPRRGPARGPCPSAPCPRRRAGGAAHPARVAARARVPRRLTTPPCSPRCPPAACPGTTHSPPCRLPRRCRLRARVPRLRAADGTRRLCSKPSRRR